MLNVTLRPGAWGEAELRLDAWREAELRLARLTFATSQWHEAEEDARSAAKAFHAAVAQVPAHYAEEDFQDRSPWSALWGRRASGAGASLADVFLGPLPQEMESHPRSAGLSVLEPAGG